MIDSLIKQVQVFYPQNLNYFEDKYLQSQEYLFLKKTIVNNRNQVMIELFRLELKDVLRNYTIKDTTYFYDDNPCIRYDLISNNNFYQLFISLLYPVFTVSENFSEMAVKIRLNDYSYVPIKELIKINVDNISANSKKIGETTLFDCYFHNN
jgi:hypothetical protein